MDSASSVQSVRVRKNEKFRETNNFFNLPTRSLKVNQSWRDSCSIGFPVLLTSASGAQWIVCIGHMGLSKEAHNVGILMDGLKS